MVKGCPYPTSQETTGDGADVAEVELLVPVPVEVEVVKPLVFTFVHETSGQVVARLARKIASVRNLEIIVKFFSFLGPTINLPEDHLTQGHCQSGSEQVYQPGLQESSDQT